MLRIFRLSLLCAALLLSAGSAQASDKIIAPSIAVIDVQRILEESLSAKSVQKQLEIRRAKFQTEIEVEENGLRQAEQELSKQRSKLAAAVYADREQQLRQRFLTVERHVQSRRKVLDQAFTDSMNTVRTALLDIASTMARDRGVNLVLVKQQTLWVDKPLDITDDLLKRLNAKLPEVAIKIAPEEKP
ncbi:MAG: OmpH family outer membrane protein [Alphaproteobacteria bacterium]